MVADTNSYHPLYGATMKHVYTVFEPIDYETSKFRKKPPERFYYAFDNVSHYNYARYLLSNGIEMWPEDTIKRLYTMNGYRFYRVSRDVVSHLLGKDFVVITKKEYPDDNYPHRVLKYSEALKETELRLQEEMKDVR